MDPFIAEHFGTVVGSSSAAAVHNNNRTLSPEPVELDETLFPRCEEQPIPGTDMASDDNDDDHKDQDNITMPWVVEEVASQLILITVGYEITNTSHIMEVQGSEHDHIGIDMPRHQQVPVILPPALFRLSKLIWTISLITLVCDIRAALHKPAMGVIFGHNKIAYYLVLSIIFASGLGEATMAFCLSRPGGSIQRRLGLGRTVLCASFLPFVAVLSITGYGLMED